MDREATGAERGSWRIPPTLSHSNCQLRFELRLVIQDQCLGDPLTFLPWESLKPPSLQWDGRNSDGGLTRRESCAPCSNATPPKGTAEFIDFLTVGSEVVIGSRGAAF